MIIPSNGLHVVDLVPKNFECKLKALRASLHADAASTERWLRDRRSARVPTSVPIKSEQTKSSNQKHALTLEFPPPITWIPEDRVPDATTLSVADMPMMFKKKSTGPSSVLSPGAAAVALTVGIPAHAVPAATTTAAAAAQANEAKPTMV